MQSDERTLQVYLDLARMYLTQQDAGMREVFLMMAADTALRMGRSSQAEQLRQELLRENPYHVLKPYPTFVEAAQHPDIEGFLDDLRQKYPLEVAEDLLESIFPSNVPKGGDGPKTGPPRSASPPPPRPPEQTAATRLDVPEPPLKVYRETYDVAETQPPPTMTGPPPQAVPKPAGQPRPKAMPRQAAPPARPAAQPRPAQSPPPAQPPVRQRPAAPRRAASSTPREEPPPAKEDDTTTAGSWVGTFLYLVVLAAAVALAMMTLVPYELFQ